MDGFFQGPNPKEVLQRSKALCPVQEHGGIQSTHNMRDCHKYEKDSTPKNAFTGKSMQHNPNNRNVPCEHNTSYAHLTEKIAKLESRTRNSIMQTKSANVITTATAMTPIHPEVMGLAALGN
jgi:hypothetical protein